MRGVKVFAATVALAFLAACGGDDTAAPTPSPTGPAATHEITGRIMGPAGDARDTVDQLNERQSGYDD
jgi:hypothetical protein